MLVDPKLLGTVAIAAAFLQRMLAIVYLSNDMPTPVRKMPSTA